MIANSAISVRVRPGWQTLLVLGALLLWLVGALAYEAVRSGRLAVPVELEVRLRPDSPSPPLRLIHVYYSGHQDPLPPALVEGGTLRWTVQDKWTRALLLVAPPSTFQDIDSLALSIGRMTWMLPSQALQEATANRHRVIDPSVPAGWKTCEITRDLPRSRSILPSFRVFVNYPGDAAVVVSALGFAVLHPVFAFLVACFLAHTFMRRWLRGREQHLTSWLAATPTEPGKNIPLPRDRATHWGVAGLLVVSFGIAVLELRQPYYFTQDDNYSQFLPGILYGCQTASSGVFPAMNPHQFLGAPLAELGTYALTYPFTYASYAAARLLGNELATLEVFCVIHLALAYATSFWLARRLGLGGPLAAALAMCWALCGFALIAGRSWYYMTPTFAWAPLLGVSALTLRDGRAGWSWTLGTGLVIGLLFHGGNAQMWAYSLGFFLLVIVWFAAAGNLAWRKLVVLAPALLIGLGLAAPLLVPQLAAMRDVDRDSGIGTGSLHGLHSIFLPYPFGIPTASCAWGSTDLSFRGEFYHAGFVFTLAWLAAWIAVWTFRGLARVLWQSPLFIPAMAALVLSLGDTGLLWFVQSKLPILDKFSQPTKFLPAFHLLSLVAGAVILQRAAALRPGRWLQGVFALTAILMIYHVLLARPALYSYADQPYPTLPAAIARAVGDAAPPARVLPIAPLRSTVAGYPFSLQHCFPTVYGVQSLGGYDPLVEMRPEFQRVDRRIKGDFVEAIRRYGVTHLIVHDVAKSPVRSPNPHFLWGETYSLYAHPAVRQYLAERAVTADADGVRVFTVTNPDPLAFPERNRRQVLPVRLLPACVEVDLDGLPQGGPVVANYLWYPGTVARADGQVISTAADEFGRIRVEIPPGSRSLVIGYQSPWRLGLLIGACLAILGLAAAAILFALKHREGACA